MLRSLAAALLLVACAARAAPAGEPIVWQPWSDAVFAQAQRENRFVLLDLEAVWCHWCHVMDQTTYRDPRVVKIVRERYIAVKVDQDSHPELSRRYEEYGWPATVVFAADGTEIAKRRGYLNPEIMLSYLEHIVRDPSPVRYRDSEPVREFAAAPQLAPALRAELERRHLAAHDFKRGGLDAVHKFLDRDSVEYALFRAREGDARAARMARQSLDGALALIDPVWGGMYQYSTHGDWRHPHFEKIMQVQADALRLYAAAWAQFRNPRHLAAAERIRRYARDFLASPEGAFYASQDADLVKGVHAGGYFALGDAARRKRGIPAIDHNRYARENGWMIHALATLYAAGGHAAALAEAERAARWVLAHRALPGGGFRHGERDLGGPFLEDSLAMGRGLLALYQATGEREWLAHAAAASAFIDERFRGAPGYLSAPPRPGAVPAPRLQVDENVALARFANLLAHHTGEGRYRAQAEHAMRLLATGAIALQRRTEPGILLAALELGADPAHLTVVGAKRDPAAQALHRAALAQPGVYRRIEWWDAAEGPLPNPDVRYPQLERAAAFVCADRACSIPLHDPGAIARFVNRRP
jgi:uncharacterized protein YyaL (SSP411 family)